MSLFHNMWNYTYKVINLFNTHLTCTLTSKQKQNLAYTSHNEARSKQRYLLSGTATRTKRQSNSYPKNTIIHKFYMALSCKERSSTYLEVDFGSLRQSPLPTKTVLIRTENASKLFNLHQLCPENK